MSEQSAGNEFPLDDGGEERRRGDRFVTILRVGVIIIDDRRELCLIRNMSSGGMLAHVYSKVIPNQRIAVELKSSQLIEGRIAWVAGANAGIAFDQPVDVAALLANPQVLDNGWRARAPRMEIDRLGTMRAGSRTWFVQARDISLGGAKLELDDPPEAGTDVVVTLEGFHPVPATVRWNLSSECGLKFLNLIPFAQLVEWLKQGE